MMLAITTPHHQSPTPLTVNLGRHKLVITNENNQKQSGKTSVRFTHDDAYRLYLCLHALFQQAPQATEGEA